MVSLHCKTHTHISHCTTSFDAENLLNKGFGHKGQSTSLSPPSCTGGGGSTLAMEEGNIHGGRGVSVSKGLVATKTGSVPIQLRAFFKRSEVKKVRVIRG